MKPVQVISRSIFFVIAAAIVVSIFVGNSKSYNGVVNPAKSLVRDKFMQGSAWLFELDREYEGTAQCVERFKLISGSDKFPLPYTFEIPCFAYHNRYLLPDDKVWISFVPLNRSGGKAYVLELEVY